MDKMTYEDTGVDYDLMDPFKRKCQIAARETAKNIERLGFREVEKSRGESAYLMEGNIEGPFKLAHVIEGLGTKNLVADIMYQLTGKSYYDQIAQDTVAMNVNDIITLGTLPLSVAMHLAVGDSDWFSDRKRSDDLIEGWKNSCMMARCVWSGGETPTLKDEVNPKTCILSGSANGIILKEKNHLEGSKIRSGDVIVLIGSSGIHANGLTLARNIAEKISDGYLTKLSDGRKYGEALLDPTVIYVSLIENCFKAGVDIHYAVNITGHGWRKLMRASEPFEYVIEKIPEPQPVFQAIQEYGPVGDKEAYANFNMGAGFALYLPEDQVKETLKIANNLGLKAIQAGHIRKSSRKKVIIKPKKLEYSQDSLQVR